MTDSHTYLGRIAYKAYHTVIINKDFTDKILLPEFDDLNDLEQEGWQQAAEAVIKSFDIRKRK